MPLPYSLFLRGVDEQSQVETKKSGASLAVAELVKAPTFLLLCVVFPVFVFGLWLLYGWLPNFLHEKFALNLADAAFNATAFLQGATLIGMLSGGVLADWLYHRTKAARLWLLTASLLLCAPCLHALGSGDSLAATRLAAIGLRPLQRLFHGEHLPVGIRGCPRGHARLGCRRAEPLRRGRVRLRAAVRRDVEADCRHRAAAQLHRAGRISWAALLLIAGIKLLFQRDYQRIH